MNQVLSTLWTVAAPVGYLVLAQEWGFQVAWLSFAATIAASMLVAAGVVLGRRSAS